MTKLVFGCGYLGQRVASRWLRGGASVHAVTRNQDRASALADAGLTPHIADIMQPRTLAALPAASTVLFAVGFDRSTNDSIENVYTNGLRHSLDAIDSRALKRFIYISSTGVYGQSSGEWVDENSDCDPTREGGKACVAAEQILKQSRVADRSVILRLAGIYGPGRTPHKRDLLQPSPMRVSNGFLNLIHVDDAADIVVRAEHLERSQSGQPALILVSDGRPVKRHAYFRELARILNVPPPKFTDPESESADLTGVASAALGTASPQKTRRRLGNKRVRTDRLMDQLKPRLNYPSYREGLEAIFGQVDAGSGES